MYLILNGLDANNGMEYYYPILLKSKLGHIEVSNLPKVM